VSGDHKAPPQTYILHTTAIAIVLIVLMVMFLKSQWGH
jgi:hypothetical protein